MFINIGKSKWMKIILFITTFAFVGTGLVALVVYKISGNIQGAAQVNGEEIPMAEFFYHVNYITNQMESKGIDTTAKKKEIYRLALENAIEQELLYQEAKKEGLEATKEEVKQYILDIDAFKEKGKFSKEKYLAILLQLNISPQMFEQILKKELSVKHLLTLHRVGFYISDDELNTFVNRQLSRITGIFVLVKPSEYKASEKEIKKYYQEHLKDFAGKKGKLIIVYKVDITKLGQEKAEKKAQDIFLKLKSGKKPEETEGVRKIFEGVVYGKKVNLPDKVKKYIEKLSNQKKIVLVSTKDSYYLIKFEKEISQPIPLEKVKNQIITRLKAKHSKEEIDKLYKKLKDILKQNPDINNLAVDYKVKPKKIEKETIQDIAMEFQVMPDDIKNLINAKVGSIVGPFKTPYGILIAKIEKIEEPEEKKKKEMIKLLKPMLTDRKYQIILQMYIDKLKENSKILINRRLFQ